MDEKTDHYHGLLSHKSPAIFPPGRHSSTRRTSLYTPPEGLYAESGSANSPILARRLCIRPRPVLTRCDMPCVIPARVLNRTHSSGRSLISVSSLLPFVSWSKWSTSIPGDHGVRVLERVHERMGRRSQLSGTAVPRRSQTRMYPSGQAYLDALQGVLAPECRTTPDVFLDPHRTAKRK